MDIDKFGPMILDALHEIKYKQDPTLSFRRSCREGICGSCAMNVNGVPTLTCICSTKDFIKTVDNEQIVEITPLQMYLPIRDLVVDLDPYYESYKLIEPWLKTKKDKDEKAERLQSIEERKLLDGLYECVLCTSCNNGCDVTLRNPEDFLGPSILMQAYRWIVDSRDD